MKDFRGPLPLDDRDFAGVRRNVMAKIERRPAVWRYALAAAAMIALAIVFWPRTTPPPRVERPRAAAATVKKPEVVALAPAVQVAEKPKPKPKRRKPERIVASAGAPPPDSEVTMNIQTADPNVRIIWISR
jgi:hypothetical protein